MNNDVKVLRRKYKGYNKEFLQSLVGTIEKSFGKSFNLGDSPTKEQLVKTLVSHNLNK
jgi:hypothetical protein